MRDCFDLDLIHETHLDTQVQELEKTLEIESAKHLGPLSTVGWSAAADDAAAAVEAGAALILLQGDPATEEAVGTAAAALSADRRESLRVLCCVDTGVSDNVESVLAACKATSGRLGKAIDVLLLPETHWACASEVLATGACKAVGLGVSTAAGALARATNTFSLCPLPAGRAGSSE